MGAPSMRPTRTTCSPGSEPPGIQAEQAACSCAPVTACTSTRRRSEWSLRTCRSPIYDPFRTDVFVSNATALEPRRAARSSSPSAVAHACRARHQRPVRGASVAALEHRRAATPVLPRRDRCWATSVPGAIIWFGTWTSTSRSRQISSGTADRRTWCARSSATTRSSCERRRPGAATMASWPVFVTRLAVRGPRP